jgi:hypothetical protein
MIAKNRHNNGRKTICKRGHPLEGENVYVSKNGMRNCKTCVTARLANVCAIISAGRMTQNSVRVIASNRKSAIKNANKTNYQISNHAHIHQWRYEV